MQRLRWRQGVLLGSVAAGLGVLLWLAVGSSAASLAGQQDAASAPGPAPAPATTALAASAPATPSDVLYLQALVPTTGDDADALLDGAEGRGWTTPGDPAEEGVLARFEQPQALTGVRLALCSDPLNVKLAVYVNGNQRDVPTLRGRQVALPFDPAPVSVRSVFVRVLSAPGKVCLGELTFLGASGAPLLVRPPRRVPGSISASSTLAPIDPYHVSYLLDGRLDFGWVEGAKGLGVGESITLTLARPVTLTALELWNGYQRSADHFVKNARATALSLVLDGGAPLSLAVADAQGAQLLALPAPTTASALTITIAGAAPGTKYPDLVLSELRLWDQAGPIAVATRDLSEREGALQAALRNKVLGAAVDRRLVSYCRGDTQHSLKLRTNHSFVWYERQATPDGDAHEVFDGAWVVQRHGSPWSEIQLYGRRHRSATVWEPYSGESSSESIRVGGGVVKVARIADLGAPGLRALVAEWSRGGAAEPVVCLAASEAGLLRRAAELAAADGIIVVGPAMTDILWPGER